MASRAMLFALVWIPLVSATIKVTNPTAASTWTQTEDQMLIWTSDPGDPPLTIEMFPASGGNGFNYGNSPAAANQFELNIPNSAVPGRWQFTISAQNSTTTIASSPIFQIIPALSSTSVLFFLSTSSGATSPTSGSSSKRPASSTASASPISSPTQAPHTLASKSNTGAIAGGVVAGVVALVIIALLAFLFRRERRKRRGGRYGGGSDEGKALGYHDSSPPSGASQWTSDVLPMGVAAEPFRPYNYEDRSTWPTTEGNGLETSPTYATHSSTGMPFGSDGRPLPEVM